MDFTLKCIACGAEYSPQEIRYTCNCGGLLDVEHDLDAWRKQVSKELFDRRVGDLTLPYASGVWRYRELILPLDKGAIVSRPEGNTNLYQSPLLSHWWGWTIYISSTKARTPRVRLRTGG